MTTASETRIKDRALVEVERLNFGYSEVSQYDLDNLSTDSNHVFWVFWLDCCLSLLMGGQHRP